VNSTMGLYTRKDYLSYIHTIPPIGTPYFNVLSGVKIVFCELFVSPHIP
jgi:hypothetical protein